MKGVLMAVLLLVMFVATHSAAEAYASLKGVVLDENGSPVEGATVTAWLGMEAGASVRTGPDGLFDLEVEGETRYSVYVFADDGSTRGIDYLPSRVEASPADGEELRFTLAPAASLTFDGDIQFVESEELPISVLYLVLDPASDGAMNVSGFPLEYGPTPESQSAFLGLEPSHLVVPAGLPFTVRVNCSFFMRRGLVSRSFDVDEPGHLPLERGDRASIDIRRYSIPFNLGVVEALQSRVESRISDMESLGFYLATEKRTTASAATWASEARFLYEKEGYIESFDAAKMSYIALRQTLTDLVNLYSDAALSVYLLIFFLAFSSTAIAFQLVNRNSTKFLAGTAVYAVTLVVLYFTYPGSVIVPLQLFVGSAALAILLTLMVMAILPRFLRARGGDGHVPVRNIVVPIFSIAKRSLRRRRLRFMLTLTSITVLVMSFVTLTSFSESYGLIVSRVSGGRAPATGVLLRAPGHIEAKPAFITLTDISSGWLERQPESRVVSPKAENFPLTMPIATLNGAPIFGVVGIETTVESSIIDLEATLLEGRLPSEGGILISDALRGGLEAEVGESLLLSGIRVTLRGVFDDAAFRRLKDLDGFPYLPRKLVNVSPEGEAPTFVLEQCEPSEIVVTDISTALSVPFVGVARVDIAVGEGIDVRAFAERLALERGYKAWSSSADGIYFARLGSYLEGKGLPLTVPWAIVVLNVVVTMLNSMYERRREIHILSSVGLNPAQIAATFVAEASIIGVAAGGIGYLAGLSLYKVMTFLRLALEVHQKVSALWSLAAIGVAMAAVLMGAIAALKSSVMITPSLMRRWRIEKEREHYMEPWEISIPVRLLPEEVAGFIGFIVHALQAREDDPIRRTSSIRVSSEAEGVLKRVAFVYKTTQPAAGNFYTKNAILLERKPDGGVTVRLRSYGDQNWAHATGTMVRMIAMEWSTIRSGLMASDRS